MLTYCKPADFWRNDRVWLAWPHLTSEWPVGLESVRRELSQLVTCIDAEGIGEAVWLLCPDNSAASEIRSQVPSRCQVVVETYGDIWLRDTGPLFCHRNGRLEAHCFEWNGWGGKFDFADDHGVGTRIAGHTGVPVIEHPWILEGGAVEVDGQGTCLTTRQCLLNPNRNPHRSAAEVEAALEIAIGARRVLWLDQGLAGDHTDGHIDTLARFVQPGHVVCMTARTDSDPNRAVLEDIATSLSQMSDVRGERLAVTTIPSPGLIPDETGAPLPASYLNFYIGNASVVVPTYGSPFDDEAVRAIGALFPDRRAVGSPAKHLITGGGAFHCITQQQPSPCLSSS